ncbi:VOC family protein [bacterium]|nr:VOC family protein [bacterium]
MANSLNANGTVTLVFGVSNLQKSLKWYGDVLSFPVDFQVEEMGWAEVKTCVPGVTIGLSQVEHPQVRGGCTPVFGVGDIDHERGKLEALNVKFDGPTITIPDMVKLATFYDEDGNKLMLVQSLAQT